jgi:hypothetical protein
MQKETTVTVRSNRPRFVRRCPRQVNVEASAAAGLAARVKQIEKEATSPPSWAEAIYRNSRHRILDIVADRILTQIRALEAAEAAHASACVAGAA